MSMSYFELRREKKRRIAERFSDLCEDAWNDDEASCPVGCSKLCPFGMKACNKITPEDWIKFMEAKE